MAFCSGCGTAVPDGSTTCAACAAKAPVAAPAGSGLTDNMAGMLAYFTIIPAILFLVMEPYNRKSFIRFHSFQCLFLAGAWIVCWIGLVILSFVFGMVLPIVAHLIGFLLWMVLLLGFGVLWLVLVLKANQGQMFKVPVIGDLAAKQAGV